MPTVTHLRTNVRTTIEYTVADALPVTMRWSRSGRSFIPDRLTVTFHNADDPPSVMLSGPRLLKSGALGERLNQSYASYHDDKWPDWVQPYTICGQIS